MTQAAADESHGDHVSLLRSALPRRNLGSKLEPSDLIVTSGLCLLVAILLIYRSDALPLQYWDESRIANNALEAALDGYWLAPAYNGAVDHWNTKPPLLIWSIAAFFKAGLPALWALRLPSIVAALATCGLAWSILRFGLRDGVAAALCGVLILCSNMYVGIHGARTGDFDGLESLFVLGYVLCLWAALEDPPRPNWLFGGVACIFAAVLTKGVAGLLPLPGCVLFLLARPRVLQALIRDVRAWFCAFAAVGLCVGYYLSRETYDPGYIRAVIGNELAGRFLNVSDGHSGGPMFYLAALFHGFEPGILLLPVSAMVFFGADPRRRDLATITLASGAALLVVLSCSKTKLFWYETPAIPLFSIAATIGVSDALHYFATRDPARARRLAVGVVVLCAAAGAGTVWVACAFYTSQQWANGLASQVRDGSFLAHLHDRGLTPPVTVMDDRFLTGPDFGGTPHRYYNQVVDFYARLYRNHWRIDQLTPGQTVRPNTMVIACSPAPLAWVAARFRLSIMVHQDGCILGRVVSAIPSFGAQPPSGYRPALGIL